MEAQNNSPFTVATLPVNNLHQPKHVTLQSNNNLESSGVGVVSVNVEEAKELLSSGHLYLDVRTIEEFEKGHVDNAINVPYMFSTSEGRVKNTEFVEQVSFECKKEDHIVVGCQSGVRSLYATTELLNVGYKNVQNMGGGYLAWVQNGFIVKMPKDELK